VSAVSDVEVVLQANGGIVANAPEQGLRRVSTPMHRWRVQELAPRSLGRECHPAMQARGDAAMLHRLPPFSSSAPMRIWNERSPAISLRKFRLCKNGRGGLWRASHSKTILPSH
jgi:hypothetical protein